MLRYGALALMLLLALPNPIQSSEATTTLDYYQIATEDGYHFVLTVHNLPSEKVKGQDWRAMICEGQGHTGTFITGDVRSTTETSVTVVASNITKEFIENYMQPPRSIWAVHLYKDPYDKSTWIKLWSINEGELCIRRIERSE